MVECQIWQDDDRVKPWSSPCTYSGRLLRIQCPVWFNLRITFSGIGLISAIY
ncbi:hypothetical protein B296_00037662 [Ensete ventricosum]|uniref:Uncharacterized protein n=1 Tax=Ensete ventricosum TaxID=4639 RepID=A0A426XJ70_ENSVE|nr:hypothetical protein B296_00037662 [Ensete ventricosum]